MLILISLDNITQRKSHCQNMNPASLTQSLFLTTTIHNLHIRHFTPANSQRDGERTVSKDALDLKLRVGLLPKGEIPVRTLSHQHSQSTEKVDLQCHRQEPHTAEWLLGTLQVSLYLLSHITTIHTWTNYSPQGNTPRWTSYTWNFQVWFSEGLPFLLLAWLQVPPAPLLTYTSLQRAFFFCHPEVACMCVLSCAVMSNSLKPYGL